MRERDGWERARFADAPEDLVPKDDALWARTSHSHEPTLAASTSQPPVCSDTPRR
jgi:hypothetical protein